MKAASSIVATCFLLAAAASPALAAAAHGRRQLLTSQSSTTAEAPTQTSTQTASTTSSQATSTTSSSGLLPIPIFTSSSTTSHTTSSSTNSASSASATLPAPVITSTNSAGNAVTITVTNGASLPSSSTPSAKPTNESGGGGGGGGGGGFGTGSIIGVSVAGGVALIAIIAFFVWKLTRKRFSDFDDSEAIKWPELNSHSGGDSHPLPTHNTGRAGFDTGSEVSLSRAPSTSNYSTPDVGVNQDPYAVPPLPHMNPNQPYRDDPNAGTGYYDPYRGPIPGTLEHGVDDYGEAIPMTQMSGRMSPGPHAAYAAGRSTSPAPPVPYMQPSRGTPGPQAAYGRASPGPQTAYNVGRVSPGPHAAYGPR